MSSRNRALETYNKRLYDSERRQKLTDGIVQIQKLYMGRGSDDGTPTQVDALRWALEEIWNLRNEVAEIQKLYVGTQPDGTTPQGPAAIRKAVQEIQRRRFHEQHPPGYFSPPIGPQGWH
ncbi:hypothetical protein HGRIS_002087 [Hohenbuehelia grisea]|uniref:Uncharacterized protein n=1 Tax=Hohenbuehelia grisea TaxID=104357 RepID=A0ABR3JJD9_9AGAR